MPLLYFPLGLLVLALELWVLPSGRYPVEMLFAGLAAGLLLLGLTVLACFWRGPASRRARVAYGVIFLLALVMPSTYFLYRSGEDFYRYPVARAIDPAPGVDEQEKPLFVLLSDPHVTDRAMIAEGKEADPRRLEAALVTATALGARACILAGDLTDRGASAEWDRLGATLRRALGTPEARRPAVLLVPGNHDLQGEPLDGVGDPAADHYVFSLPFVNRAHGYFEVARAWGTVGDSPFSSLWADLTREAEKATWVTVPRRPAPGGTQQDPLLVRVYPPGFGERFSAAFDAFNMLFPVVYQGLGEEAAIVLLDSSTRVNPGTSMGIGNLGSAQLDRLKAQLGRFRADARLKLLIVAIHHAPVRRETDRWSFAEAFQPAVLDTAVWAHTFLSLDVDDACGLVQLLEEFAGGRGDVDVVLAHGHRHGRYLGKTAGGVVVVEAPAVVTGDHGFWAGYRTNGALRLRWIALDYERAPAGPSGKADAHH